MHMYLRQDDLDGDLRTKSFSLILHHAVYSVSDGLWYSDHWHVTGAHSDPRQPHLLRPALQTESASHHWSWTELQLKLQ